MRAAGSSLRYPSRSVQTGLVWSWGGSQVSPPPRGCHSAELRPPSFPIRLARGIAATALSPPCSPSFPVGHVSPCD